MDTMKKRSPTPVPADRVTIQTTLPPAPLPRSIVPAIIQTPRLTLRPYEADDLASLCALRSQPEVMIYTATGSPEPADTTRRLLEVRLAQQRREDNDGRLEYAICLREDGGKLIGHVGIQLGVSFGMGWPSLGYQLRREFWGRGYMTEAVGAVMEAWWALERSEREVCVDGSTVQATYEDQKLRGRECVAGMAEEGNLASRRVLEKCGFALVKEWEERDPRDVSMSRMARLCGYVARAPLPN